MKLHKAPSFRRVILPWYNSDLFCLFIAVLAALVFYFGTAGLSVSLGNDSYSRYRWVPMTLMAFSGILLVRNLFRVLSRIARRLTQEDR